MNMKKNLFFALFACATLAFVGCEPTPEPLEDPVVITVDPDTLLLGVGDTYKLNATIAPTGTQVTIAWTSDNEEVVTVAPSGIVIATGVGTANVIASAEGATADTCVITVTNDALYDNFVFSDYALFATNEGIQLIPGSETVVELGIGETVCSLAELYFVGWDEDIVFVDGAGFSGAGFYFENLVQVYIVNDPDPAKAQYNGALVGWGGYWVDTLEAAEPYVVEAGQLLDKYFAEIEAEQKAQVEAMGAAMKEEGEAFLQFNAEQEGVVSLPSGLQYKVITEGTGKKPSATDKVKCHYEGTLINGMKFDSSYDRNEPAVFGLNQVIPGWTEGVQLMSEGSKYEFVIPYDLAYGAHGAPGAIPPYATLKFVVELIEVL